MEAAKDRNIRLATIKAAQRPDMIYSMQDKGLHGHRLE